MIVCPQCPCKKNFGIAIYGPLEEEKGGCLVAFNIKGMMAIDVGIALSCCGVRPRRRPISFACPKENGRKKRAPRFAAHFVDTLVRSAGQASS